MKIESLSKDELENMSYGEIAEAILNEKGSKLKIVEIFRKICDLLELSESVFESRIGDFFEMVSTDKNFIVLDKGFCDLKTRHSVKVVIEDDEEAEAEEELTEDEENIEEEDTEEDIFYDSSSSDDDVADADELEDFIIEGDDEDEETSM